MSPAEMKDVAWLLMLIPMGILVGSGLYFLFCALRRAHWQHQIDATLEASLDPALNLAASSFGASLLEAPCRWLAIKGASTAAVQAALNLHHTVPCSWEEGLVEAREDKLFVSPPVSDWVLVLGSGLPDPAEDVDRCYLFLVALSRKVGQVQFYTANRVLNHHAWALLDKGRVQRAYAWAGETLWNQGPLTAAEKELDMQCLDYGAGLNIFSQRDALASNSEKINQLAARWSVDPAAISEVNEVTNGIVGELSHSKRY